MNVNRIMIYLFFIYSSIFIYDILYGIDLLIIFETSGQIYPASTDLHSLHHRPLSKGKIKAKATIIKRGRNIASIKGELVDKQGRVATTLMHTAYLVQKTIK